MSFILDALKKVEKEKRGTDARGVSMVAFSSADDGHRGQLVMMLGIALSSALVTAGVLFAVSSNRGVDPAGPTASAVSAGSPGDDIPTTRSGPVPTASAPVTEEKPADTDEVATTPVQAPSPPPAPVRAPAPAPAPEVRSAAAPPVGIEVEAPIAEPVAAVVEEPGHPINIVGREHAAFAALDREPSGRPDAIEEDPSAEEDASGATRPDLVLQGTSVLDGQDVAVINGQRVFVGDWIEGARVVEIREREVALELDGRRITLRL